MILETLFHLEFFRSIIDIIFFWKFFLVLLKLYFNAIKEWTQLEILQLQLGYEVRWQQTLKYGYLPNANAPEAFFAATYDLTDHSSPTSRSGDIYI